MLSGVPFSVGRGTRIKCDTVPIQYLRGIILNTCGRHKTLYISLFLLLRGAIAGRPGGSSG